MENGFDTMYETPPTQIDAPAQATFQPHNLYEDFFQMPVSIDPENPEYYESGQSDSLASQLFGLPVAEGSPPADEIIDTSPPDEGNNFIHAPFLDSTYKHSDIYADITITPTETIDPDFNLAQKYSQNPAIVLLEDRLPDEMVNLEEPIVSDFEFDMPEVVGTMTFENEIEVINPQVDIIDSELEITKTEILENISLPVISEIPFIEPIVLPEIEKVITPSEQILEESTMIDLAISQTTIPETIYLPASNEIHFTEPIMLPGLEKETNLTVQFQEENKMINVEIVSLPEVMLIDPIVKPIDIRMPLLPRVIETETISDTPAVDTIVRILRKEIANNPTLDLQQEMSHVAKVIDLLEGSKDSKSIKSFQSKSIPLSRTNSFPSQVTRSFDKEDEESLEEVSDELLFDEFSIGFDMQVIIPPFLSETQKNAFEDSCVQIEETIETFLKSEIDFPTAYTQSIELVNQVCSKHFIPSAAVIFAVTPPGSTTSLVYPILYNSDSATYSEIELGDQSFVNTSIITITAEHLGGPLAISAKDNIIATTGLNIQEDILSSRISTNKTPFEINATKEENDSGSTEIEIGSGVGMTAPTSGSVISSFNSEVTTGTFVDGDYPQEM